MGGKGGQEGKGGKRERGGGEGGGRRGGQGRGRGRWEGKGGGMEGKGGEGEGEEEGEGKGARGGRPPFRKFLDPPLMLWSSVHQFQSLKNPFKNVVYIMTFCPIHLSW